MNVQSSEFQAGRLTSLDTYRGFVMFLMVAEVLHLSRVAEMVNGSWFWNFLAYHQTHVEWVGCSLHDLIQPSFSFMVGVALPYSIASRIRKGQSFRHMVFHAFVRALILVFLGIFLRSIGHEMTRYTFEDTLTQIGLGYGFLFLLGFRPVRDQWIALGVILFGYWLAFALYPLPEPGFDYSTVGVPNDWPHLMSGFAAHWNINTNLAMGFDRWFLNLFPREETFLYNGGGYATLSFIPTLGTMILGLIAGGILRNEGDGFAKVKKLLLIGAGCMVGGLILHWLGLCPIVKRIWTPSWTLFSGGWCFFILAGLYALIDLYGYKRWTFFLVVIGMNSIAIYCMAHIFDRFIHDALYTHLGKGFFLMFGAPYETLVSGTAIILVLWLILYWMYNRKIFLRV